MNFNKGETPMAVKKKAPAKKKASVQKKVEAATLAVPHKPASIKKADIREVGKYALLLGQKADAEEAVKKLNAQILKLFPQILDYFQRQGVDQLSTGGRTLYLRRELQTSKRKEFSTQDACAKLEEVGLGEYSGVKVNIQGLAAHVRELEREGQELAEIEEDLGGVFRVVELFKIGSRKK
jgi:hypothetical protein